MKDFTDEQIKRVCELGKMSDWEFYEKYLADAPLEEQTAFMKEFPEFMCGGNEVDIDVDEMLQEIMERISI